MNINLIEIKLVNILENIKKLDDKIHQLYELGLDLISFTEDYDKTINLLLDCILDEEGVELVYWWLYDSSDKIFYYKEDMYQRNVESSEDFAKYLVENNLLIKNI